MSTSQEKSLSSVYAEDFIKYTKSDMQHLAETYMRICFRLYEADRNKYYEALGYPDICSCCEQELDINRSVASRMINICKRFSANGHSMYIADKYKKYNYSQLCEMVSMKDSDLKSISPDMTVKDIRECKKKLKSRFHDAIDQFVKDFGEMMKKKNQENDGNDDSSVATSQLKESCISAPSDYVSSDIVRNDEEVQHLEDDEEKPAIPDASEADPFNSDYPETIIKDLKKNVKDFNDYFYLWLKFDGICWSFYRYDIGMNSYIICIDTDSCLIEKNAIEAYYIYPSGMSKCFNEELCTVSKKHFYEMLNHDLNGVIK